MTDMYDATPEPGYTFALPTRYCAVHGQVSQFITFNFGDHDRPSYCVRCAADLFEKLGVTVVTETPT